MIRSESLPYFGKINSISRIEEYTDENKGKYYLVKRYNSKGTEKKETFVIPANIKNITGLIKDFCIDLNDYLTKNENKYINLRSKKRIFNLNISSDKLNFASFLGKVGVCFGTGLVGINFVIPSIPVLLYVGMSILLLSSTSIFIISDIKKELKEVSFVRNYDGYTYKLNEYKNYIKGNNDKGLTKYRGVSHEKNIGNILKMKKVKTLN